MSAPGEYDDKDVVDDPRRADAKPANEGEYDDKNVADDTERSEAEPEGSFVDKDVAPRAATEHGEGEYDDKDKNG
jgi:hypothetical protein